MSRTAHHALESNTETREIYLKTWEHLFPNEDWRKEFHSSYKITDEHKN
jgi:hypothetical protein